MGCFGGSTPPSYNPPNIQLPTAGDLYGQANNFWQNTSPTLYNAQSNAVKNSTDPNYYNSFQPSSFQQALGNQYFQNIWPDTQAFMKNQLSQTGMINTPGASQAMGNTLGNIETNIGQYLSGIGQQQANTGIQAGLGVPLSGLLNPFVQTGQQQSDQQANLQLAQSQAQYQNMLNQYQYGQQQSQGLGGALGAIGGLALAPFTGGMSMALPLMGMGSQLGTGLAGGAMNPYALAFSGLGAAGGLGAIGSGANGVNFAGNTMNGLSPTMAGNFSMPSGSQVASVF